MTFQHIDAEGNTTDVTEHVQTLYDLVLNSMDWGSGFLGVEDSETVYRVGELGGFELPCMACKFPNSQYMPEPTCPESKRAGNHCKLCEGLYRTRALRNSSAQLTYGQETLKSDEYVERAFGNLQHWPLCERRNCSFEKTKKLILG